VVQAVDGFVAGLGQLDDAEQVLAQTALALAGKLDQARDSATAAAAGAAPALARQRVEVVGALRGDIPEPDHLDELMRRREARRLAVASGALASPRSPRPKGGPAPWSPDWLEPRNQGDPSADETGQVPIGPLLTLSANRGRFRACPHP